jgi:hypothetical protein
MSLAQRGGLEFGWTVSVGLERGETKIVTGADTVEHKEENGYGLLRRISILCVVRDFLVVAVGKLRERSSYGSRNNVSRDCSGKK